MPDLRLGQHVLQQVRSRRVEPLQIIQEQHEWLSRLYEHAQETPEHPSEAVRDVLGWDLRGEWLRADDQLELRNQADNELGIFAQRRLHALAPPEHFPIRAAQELSDEAAAGMHQRGVGNIALVLIELALSKPSPCLNQLPVQLLN